MKNITVWCTAAAVLVAIASAMAENEKPVIISQPTSVKAKVGDSVTFTVGARDVNTNDKKNFTTSILGMVDLDMIWVNPGTFMMGSPETEMGHQDNETLHKVTLTKGFWMGKYEVTQAQYYAVMREIPRSMYADDEDYKDNKPVFYVGEENAETFCDRLTQIERAAGNIPMNYKYTLPTEAQWEYACRAGTTTALNNGKNLLTSWLSTDVNLDEVAWYGGNSDYKVHEVGQKLPNAWGFYDMHGNVCEWCLDRPVEGSIWNGFYIPSLGAEDVTDPFAEGAAALVRGGSSQSEIANTRSGYRGYRVEDALPTGFRVVLVPVE